MAFIRKVCRLQLLFCSASYSRGEDIVSSDIDIAIIGAKEKRNRALPV